MKKLLIILALSAGFAWAAAARADPVLVSFTARDAHGAVIRDLRASEVTIFEDNKPQKITAFELEDLAAPPPAGSPFAKQPYAGHRLVVLYFDLTTMAPRDEDVAVESAQYYLDHVKQPGDLVGVAALGNTLQVLQDFTRDAKVVTAALGRLGPALNNSATAVNNGENPEMQTTAADRDLISLQSLCDQLAWLPARKAVFLYSGGLLRSAVNNEITLRSAVNAAVKGDIGIYALDTHLLPARGGGGGGGGGGGKGGAGEFNGQAQTNQLNNQESRQDTLATLSNDTGGSALLSSSDDAGLYHEEQSDGQVFYLASYNSTNPKADGKYRKITVKVARPDVKLSFRPGYEAAKK